MSYEVIRRRPAARGGDETSGATPFVIEGESTAHLVSLASRLFSRALQERLGRYGVSVAQWSMLLLLWEEESLTQKELSRPSADRGAHGGADASADGARRSDPSRGGPAGWAVGVAWC